MMQQCKCGGNMMHPCNCRVNMMQPAQAVVCPTQYRCHDQFIPREVPFIHPIVNVNRQHIVEVPRHFYTETTRNVMGETLQAQPGFGPGFGPEFGPGFGPEFGPEFGHRGRRRRF